jgi:hypothetical protein
MAMSVLLYEFDAGVQRGLLKAGHCVRGHLSGLAGDRDPAERHAGVRRQDPQDGFLPGDRVGAELRQLALELRGEAGRVACRYGRRRRR